jgi:hypothetical protein
VPSVKIPRDVRQFVARFLPSVEHLETFVVLCSNTTRWWSGTDIAETAGIEESVAADVLEGLASNNFVDVKISNEILYRFNPAKTATGVLSKRCIKFYLRDRIALINLAATGARAPTHDFAEALRLKKKDTKDG